MMLTLRDFVQTAPETIEAFRVAQHRQGHADEKRSAAEWWAAVAAFAVGPTAAPPGASALEREIMAFVSRHTLPTTFGAIVDATKVAPITCRLAIDRLERAGVLERRGVRRGQTIGTPAVMARHAGAPEAPPRPTPKGDAAAPPRPAVVVGNDLVDTVLALLRKTASSLSVVEIGRQLGGMHALIAVTQACDQLVRQAKVERLVLHRSIRYRAVHRWQEDR